MISSEVDAHCSWCLDEKHRIPPRSREGSHRRSWAVAMSNADSLVHIAAGVISPIMTCSVKHAFLLNTTCDAHGLAEGIWKLSKLRHTMDVPVESNERSKL